VEVVVEEKVKLESHGRSERHFIAWRGREVSPAAPSDRRSVRMKMLRWLEAVA
jgi:hypothetical protein